MSNPRSHYHTTSRKASQREIAKAQEAAISSARARIVRRHRHESWAEIAKSIGLPKTTVRFFAERGYLPKRKDILLKLLTKGGPHRAVIVQEVRRDELGRFAKRQ